MATLLSTPSIAQTAEVLRQVRAEADEAKVNRFLVAVERQWGYEHMRAAHALATEIYLAEREAEYQAEQAAKADPAPYRLIGGDVGEWKNGIYRFYCTRVSWQYSPAARSGAVLVEG